MSGGLGYVFAAARGEFAGQPALDRVARVMRGHEARFLAPMSVALVGRVSSGKSTLVNALLGGTYVATGVRELTFTVAHLRQGEPRIVVHFREKGRPVETYPPEEIDALTVNDPAQLEFLRSIDFLDVYVGNDYLRQFAIVDTPGLDAHLGTESQTTLNLLGRTGGDVRESTVTHAAGADAIVLVFTRRGLHEDDVRVLTDFAGADVAGLGPLNTVGALNQVEALWRPGNDPMAEATRVAGNLMSIAEVGRSVYEMIPVAGLLAAAAGTCDAEDLARFEALSKVDPGRLERIVARGDHFATRDYPEITVPAGERKALVDRYSQWGVVLATSLARDGVTTVREMRAELEQRSGLERLRGVLTGHFGNRAGLIKTTRVYAWADDLPYGVRPTLPPRAQAALDRVTRRFTELRLREENEHDELKALRAHYDGQLRLPLGGGAELLRVTGEHGMDPAARLGCAAGTPAAEMLQVTRERRTAWASAAMGVYNGATTNAIRVIQNAYVAVERELEPATA
ncbi:dynamin family protein [Actinoplanes bogorensis]|uniref:Dynamin family protein n=1 Tax=Paractinoplanes bogorensis TaxID=1610840 RepID=A0ABS5YUN2_9ACTN|nr:dynamin family protein [Actinoplanes bogorensis]MBU2667165.1 dynamin family protein [Actinoplanes bogorensis]